MKIGGGADGASEEGRLVLEEAWYFGPSQPLRPTGDSPGIPDGQSAPGYIHIINIMVLRASFTNIATAA